MAAPNSFAAPPPAAEGAAANAKTAKAESPEVAYLEVPPAIEDVTIEGPTRSRIPYGQTTYDDFKLIASDYNWFRYSGCALPTLLVLGFLFTLTLSLTFWQGPMNIIEMRDGVARRFYELDDDNDGGIDFVVGHLRIAAFACGATATLFCLFTWQTGKVGLITLGNFIAMFFYLCASVLYWVAFGFTATSENVAHQCFRNQWVPENPGGRTLRVTAGDYERCDVPNKAQSFADTANVIDACLGFFAFVTLVWLFLANGKKAWKRYTPQEVFKMKLDYGQPQREMKVRDRGVTDKTDPVKAQKIRDQVNKAAWPQQHVKSVFRNFAVFLVYFTAALLVVSLVFTILLHETRPEQEFRGTIGATKAASYEDSLSGAVLNRHQRVEYSGWPKINNRLRIAANACGLLLVILTLIPWRSRVVAYFLGIAFVLVAVLQFTAFGFDVKAVDDARNGVWKDIDADSSCNIPNGHMSLNCEFGGFEAVCVLDILAGLVLVWYLLYEFVLRVKSAHDGRKLPLFEKADYDKNLHFMRPVVPEVHTNLVKPYDASNQGQADMNKASISAGYFFYQHRYTILRDQGKSENREWTRMDRARPAQEFAQADPRPPQWWDEEPRNVTDYRVYDAPNQGPMNMARYVPDAHEPVFVPADA